MSPLLSVRVQPRARRPGVEKTGENAYTVRVAVAPEKGRANREVEESLADYLGVPRSRVRIIRGLTSARKIVEVP